MMGISLYLKQKKNGVLNNFFASVFTHENTDIEIGERSNNITLGDVRVKEKGQII